MGVYSANEIAKYVIYYFNQKNKEITNLKLQKILYYIQVEFIKDGHGPAFCDEIQAWRHGPVVPNVYYKYNIFTAQPICLNPQIKDLIQIDERDKGIINKVISSCEDIPAWSLVKSTHEEYPWSHCYQEGENNIINIKDIQKYVGEQK